MRTLAVVPLQAADQTLGLLQVAFDQPDSFLKEHRRPLAAIAKMGSNALQRAQTMEMLEQLVQDRTRELATLYEVTRTATQHLDLQVILDRVLGKALEVIGGEASLVHLLDDAGETLHLAAQRGIPAGLMDQAQAPGGSLWGQVVERDETIIRTLKVSETFRVSPEESPTYIGAPIHARGRILGALSLFRAASQSFSGEDIALLAGIADHIGAAVESAQLRQRGQETAVDDLVVTQKNTAVTFNALSNDTDVDGDQVNVSAVGSAAHGTVFLQPNIPVPVPQRKITYTPAQDFTGTDEFTYTITDGALTATGSVTVRVVTFDVNGDGAVDVADIMLVAGGWHSRCGGGEWLRSTARLRRRLRHRHRRHHAGGGCMEVGHPTL